MAVDIVAILENLKRENEEPIYMDEVEENREEISKDLETAIEILKSKERINFTLGTLNLILDEIVEEFFSDETIMYGYGLMDVIDAVKAKYSDEISSLEIE